MYLDAPAYVVFNVIKFKIFPLKLMTVRTANFSSGDAYTQVTLQFPYMIFIPTANKTHTFVDKKKTQAQIDWHKHLTFVCALL